MATNPKIRLLEDRLTGLSAEVDKLRAILTGLMDEQDSDWFCEMPDMRDDEPWGLDTTCGRVREIIYAIGYDKR